MPRSRRIAVIAVVSCLIGLEVGLRVWRGPCVEVVVENRTGATIRGLSLRSDGGPITAGTLADGGDTCLRVDASGRSPLMVSYRDDDGHARSMELVAFEGKRLRDEGLRFVVVLLPDGLISEYNEDDPSAYARVKQALWSRTSITLPFPF